MGHDRKTPELIASDLPRRLRSSSREIGVAVALTFAAAVQLISALTAKEHKASRAELKFEPSSVIRLQP
jgi:hypothetical protein